MFYQQNLLNKPNSIPNYTKVQNNQNTFQIINNNQYKLPEYTNPINNHQLNIQPGYSLLKNNQNQVYNNKQITNIQINPNMQLMHFNQHNLIEDNNVHNHNHHNMLHQHQQFQKMNSGQILRTNQNNNIKQQGLVFNGEQQQIKYQIQPGHHHDNIINQNNNINPRINPITNQPLNQQNNQKLVFREPKPLAQSYNPFIKNQNLIQKNNNQQQKQKINKTVLHKVEKKEQKEKSNEIDNKSYNKSVSFMTLNSLAGIYYNNYPMAEFSKQNFFNISGYGSNSYNGKKKSYNEDKIKIRYKEEKIYKVNGKDYKAYISYFGLFDGHGGEICSKFLKQYLDEKLFSLPIFPNNVIESIKETFKSAERKFKNHAIKNGILVDKSGSCALISLIINNDLYCINLGDSRAIYSRNSGQEFYQISRDHKPNDIKEKARIEKAGGKVYYANQAFINGVVVTFKEEQFGRKFPYRLFPSGLAVSIK